MYVNKIIKIELFYFIYSCYLIQQISYIYVAHLNTDYKTCVHEKKIKTEVTFGWSVTHKYMKKNKKKKHSQAKFNFPMLESLPSE